LRETLNLVLSCRKLSSATKPTISAALQAADLMLEVWFQAGADLDDAGSAVYHQGLTDLANATNHVHGLMKKRTEAVLQELASTDPERDSELRWRLANDLMDILKFGLRLSRPLRCSEAGAALLSFLAAEAESSRCADSPILSRLLGLTRNLVAAAGFVETKVQDTVSSDCAEILVAA
jgi:hypothetical protein